MLSSDDLQNPPSPQQILGTILAGFQGVGQVVQVGVGFADPVGTGKLSVLGPVTTAGQVVVRIDVTGTLNTGEFSVSIDGGLTFAPALTGLTIPQSGQYLLQQIGVTLVFTPGVFNAATSFLQGETYLFQADVPTLPITDWEEFASLLTAAMSFSIPVADFAKLLKLIVNGGYASGASGRWADRVGVEVFDEQRKGGQLAIGTANVTCAVGFGPYTLNPGQLTISIIATGLQFTNSAQIVIPGDGNPHPIQLQASQVGAGYNAPTHVSGAAVLQVTSGQPGLTVDNPPILGAVSHAGTGTGTLTLTGAPTGAVAAIVKIQKTGNVVSGIAGATYTVSFDGGNTFLGPYNCHDIPLFVAGVSGTFAGAFVQGDAYTFSTSWLTTTGVDVETDFTYMARCIAKWGSLSPNGPDAFYVFEAQAAALEIQQVTVNADQVVAGQVNVIVGGPSGAVSSAALAAALQRLQPRAALCDLINVVNETNFGVALTGTVYVAQSSIAAAQAYLGPQLALLQTQIGPGGNVRYTGSRNNSPLAVLQSAPGFDRVEGFAQNGVEVDILLGSLQFPIIDPSALTWVPV